MENQKPPANTLWVLLLGGIGFGVGFFGPIILRPDANQGPLLGILITGPLGAVLGLVLFSVAKAMKMTSQKQWRLLKTVAVILAVVPIPFMFPEPVYKSDLFQTQIANCRPVEQASEEIIKFWDGKIAEVTWATPRSGWKDQMRMALKHDKGLILDTLVLESTKVYEHRKPWNWGKITQRRQHKVNELKSFYVAEASDGCSRYSSGLQLKINVDRNVEIRPPKEWPPESIAEFIPFTIAKVN